MYYKFQKTKLDEDALMYQKSKDSVTKEDIKGLSLKGKLQYFKDYYGIKILVVILIIISICSLLNTTIFNRSTCVLSLIFLNECQIKDGDQISNELEEHIATGEKNDYVSLEMFNLTDPQMNMAYITRIAAGSADVVICSINNFIEQSAQGNFLDMREFLPKEMYDSLSDNFIEGQISEIDEEGNVISSSEPIPFGIDLSNSSVFENCEMYCTDPVLCVVKSTSNAENALKAIEYFTEK